MTSSVVPLAGTQPPVGNTCSPGWGDGSTTWGRRGRRGGEKEESRRAGGEKGRRGRRGRIRD